MCPAADRGLRADTPKSRAQPLPVWGLHPGAGAEEGELGGGGGLRKEHRKRQRGSKRRIK